MRWWQEVDKCSRETCGWSQINVPGSMKYLWGIDSVPSPSLQTPTLEAGPILCAPLECYPHRWWTSEPGSGQWADANLPAFIFHLTPPWDCKSVIWKRVAYHFDMLIFQLKLFLLTFFLKEGENLRHNDSGPLFLSQLSMLCAVLDLVQG